MTKKHGGIILAIWFLVALIAGATGLTQRLMPPAPQLIIVSLSLLLIICGLTVKSFKSLLLNIDWKIIVAFHLVRFVGFYFILLFLKDELPYEFAVPAGVGDIFTATVAAALLITYKRVTPGILAAWNLFGLLDIIFVVITAGRLGMANPYLMRELLHLPLSLLPTFFVPLIFSSHILLLLRKEYRTKH